MGNPPKKIRTFQKNEEQKMKKLGFYFYFQFRVVSTMFLKVSQIVVIGENVPLE